MTKTVRLTLSPDNFSQVGKIDAERVDATTEAEIAQHIAADEADKAPEVALLALN